MNTPPSATSDRTIWWGFGVLAAVLVASLVGFAWLPTPPDAAAGSDSSSGPSAGPGNGPASPTPSPTPEPPRVTDPAESALYRMELNLSTCPEVTPRSDTIPKAKLRGYLESVVKCLSSSNQAALEQAGLPTVVPKLAEDNQLASSPCGREDPPTGWAALYCPGNNTIYYHPDWKESDGPYVGVMAHEYAHHLQWLTGLLDLVHEQGQEAKQQPNGQIKNNELSRRTELQAQCIAGATLTGDWSPLKSRPIYDEFVAGTSSMPPENAATHGSGRANNRWLAAGATSTAPTHYKACNTFSAPADQVE